MVSMYDMGSQFEQRTAASVFGSIADGEKYFGIDRAYLFAADLQNGVEREPLIKRVQLTLGDAGDESQAMYARSNSRSETDVRPALSAEYCRLLRNGRRIFGRHQHSHGRDSQPPLAIWDPPSIGVTRDQLCASCWQRRSFWVSSALHWDWWPGWRWRWMPVRCR